MAEKACSGDCLKCGLQQQVYCAAQHGHAIMENQRAETARLDAMDAVLSDIKAAIAGFTTQGDIINPLKDREAQEGSGAENREPETTI